MFVQLLKVELTGQSNLNPLFFVERKDNGKLSVHAKTTTGDTYRVLNVNIPNPSSDIVDFSAAYAQLLTLSYVRSINLFYPIVNLDGLRFFPMIDNVLTRYLGALNASSLDELNPIAMPQSNSITTNSEPLQQTQTSQPIAESPANTENNLAWLIHPHYSNAVNYNRHYGYSEEHTLRNNVPTISNPDGYKIGVELEVSFNSDSIRNKFCSENKNWLRGSADSSLSGIPNPVEIVTIPLVPSDARSVDFWKPSMDWLKANANSKRFRETGLHIHVGKEALGTTESQRLFNMAKLYYFYYSFLHRERAGDSFAVKLNDTVFGRASTYGDRTSELLTKINRRDFFSLSHAGADEPSELFAEIANSVYVAVSTERYVDLNIKRWDSFGTIEFRRGKGIISAKRLAGLITYIEVMIRYVCATAPKDLNAGDFIAIVSGNETIKNVYGVAPLFITPQQDDEG